MLAIGPERRDGNMSEDKMTPEQKARAQEQTDEQNKADVTNKTRSGKGTRIRVGQTRGKNPKVISWEAFDTDQPATCPTSPAEFMELAKVNDDATLTKYLIDGFNDAMYSAASDVLAEYVESNWDSETVRRFKLAISNYSAGAGIGLEDAVEIIKPGFSKAFNARLAAAAA